MPVPNLRPLGFGEILDGAFSLYRRNLVTFFLTAVLPLGALAASGVLMVLLMGSGSELAADIGGFGLIILLALDVRLMTESLALAGD